MIGFLLLTSTAAAAAAAAATVAAANYLHIKLKQKILEMRRNKGFVAFSFYKYMQIIDKLNNTFGFSAYFFFYS